MLNWLKRVFRDKPDAVEDANAISHENLNRLRCNELSVGACMRRGEPVNTFPGLASGATMITPNVVTSMTAPASSKAVDDTAKKSIDGDFVTSMAVSAGTGSAMMGYAVGGSISGAMIGSSMSDNITPHNSTASTTDSGSCGL